LRRVGLIASQSGDVILLGSSHSAGTLRLQQFLTRNSFPFVNLDVNTDQGVQALLGRFHVSAGDAPVGRGPRAWRPPCMGPRRDSTYWCSKQGRPAAKPARARKKKTTSGFPPAFRAGGWPAKRGFKDR